MRTTVERVSAAWLPAFLVRFLLSPRLPQFLKFCLVGGSGVLVDMGMLFLLADPRCFGLGVTLGKILAAETALINNFIWNDLWTFRPPPSFLPASGSALPAPCSPLPAPRSGLQRLRRFLLFNVICVIGIGLAVLFLHVFHFWLGWNLYLSNLLAIVLTTAWNFGLNARFNWTKTLTAYPVSLKQISFL